MYLLFLLKALWASTFTFGKILLEYLPPVLLIAIRMTGAGVLLLTYQYFFKHEKFELLWKDAWVFAKISFFFMYFAFITEFWALQDVTAAKACLLFNLTPFITALLSYFMLSERITKKQFVALIIGFLGFLPILISQANSEPADFSVGFISLPEILLLASVVSSAYGWILIHKLVVHRKYSVPMVNGVSMLAAGIMAWITSFAIEGMPVIYIANNARFGLSACSYSVAMMLFYMVLTILIANVLCFNLQSELLKYYSITFITFFAFITPLFAALFDWLLFGIVAPPAFFVTVAIVAVGLYLYYQDELRLKN